MSLRGIHRTVLRGLAVGRRLMVIEIWMSAMGRATTGELVDMLPDGVRSTSTKSNMLLSGSYWIWRSGEEERLRKSTCFTKPM